MGDPSLGLLERLPGKRSRAQRPRSQRFRVVESGSLAAVACGSGLYKMSARNIVYDSETTYPNQLPIQLLERCL